MRSTVLCCGLLLLACDPDPGADAGTPLPDAGPVDAARPDAGVDAGPPRVDLCEGVGVPGPFPAPDAWTNTGPGGPTASYVDADLYEHCAYLDGGDLDTADHHNLVVMYDGYLLMPWAPEFGAGGLTFWEFTDPCNPVVVGSGHSPTMRETHSIGFSNIDGRWAVVNELTIALFEQGGIQFWDVSDPSAPEPVADLELPGFQYPDAYARVSLSVFWQAPYVYVGGSDNGVWIVDAADPRAPRYVGVHPFEPVHRVGQVQAIGNVLVATAAEGARTVLLDISDPESPQPIPGGDFLAMDTSGRPREAYFTNVVGGRLLYANKDGGGGLVMYDITNPSAPTLLGSHISDGNGGYVFANGDLAFVGESSFATIYDISDPSTITEVQRLDLVGDLDTAAPVGNVVVLSVDDEAMPDQGSAVVPYATAPDTRAPVVRWVWPADGATGLRTSSRVGISFDEMVDVNSAHEGSVRLYRAGGTPDEGRVATIVSAQESIVNVHPRCPLEPNTEYVLEVMTGGVADFSGNPLTETTTVHFTTGPE
ncbi:MAG: Ig-like domain-containing protein [Sandaracinaceae bacterium]|nr:Ig-like domain-containing protein [Sandaracinaceae bacterium]